MSPGPLYGCPAQVATRWLVQLNSGFPHVVKGGSLRRYRLAERFLQARGMTPLTTWWVLGSHAPTVGGQMLTGIPVVRSLRYNVALRPSRVWPFEGGFGAEIPDKGPFVLHVEIWPGVVSRILQPLAIRDRAQVRAMVAWCADEDARGTLSIRFDTPPRLSAKEVRSCVREEGWILGAH